MSQSKKEDGFSIYREIARQASRSSRSEDEAGLGIQHRRVLVALLPHKDQPMPFGDLSKESGLTFTELSRAIEDLLSSQAVRIEGAAGQERVHLTDLGVEMAEISAA